MEAMVGRDNPWLGARVVVTGHTGFKGSWLSLWLAELGAEVHGIALAPTEPSLFEVARVEESLASSSLLDIRDHARLSSRVADIRPTVVFHLAAQPLVRRSYAQPLETLETNVMGTANVLESCRGLNTTVRAIVVVTSDKCYRNDERLWGYREGEPLGGRDPYSASKACTELVAAAYRESFLSSEGPLLATVRAGNVIGGGDWSEDRLIPDAVRVFEAGERIVLRYPGAVRPWQHVLDPLLGYLHVAERLLVGERSAGAAWNFGPLPGEEWTVADVVAFLAHRWPNGGEWVTDETAQLHEASVLRLDSTKARVELGWMPRLTTEEALQWTADWHLKVLGGMDARAVALDQLRVFRARRHARSSNTHKVVS